MKAIIRLASHAGSWYEANSISLSNIELLLDQELTACLDNADCQIHLDDPLQVKAIIGPHAGFYYSGKVSAWGYKYLQKLKGRNLRVFLIGPSHFKNYAGISISSCTELATPLGNIAVDLESVQQLKKQIKVVTITKRQEQKEHSLEMHMPFIKKVLGDAVRVVPIMVGTLDPETAQEFGQILRKYFEDENTVFIVSTDFCHWGGEQFGYQPYDKSSGLKIWQFIEQLDQRGMKLIENNDITNFWSYLKETENSICGEMGIKILMNAIQQSQFKYKTQFVNYDQSNKVVSWDDSSVSYAASVTYRLKE